VKVVNQAFEFLPPDCDKKTSIRILGLGEYCLSGSDQCDSWIIQVPPELVGRLKDNFQCKNAASVKKTLAQAFYGGDEMAVVLTPLKLSTAE
jgi:hypothetical protein